MRPLRPLLAALGLAVATSLTAVAQGQKAFAVVPKTGPLANRTLYTNSHALLVGISKYADPRVPQLKYADKDALALRETLIRSYGFPAENVTVLLNEQATKAAILQGLGEFADEARVKPDDRVLIYFSGHGQTVSLPGSGEMGFLIPHDAKVDLAQPQNRTGYVTTCLDMETVWRTLRLSAAKHALVLADACYGGQLTQSRAVGTQIPRPNAAVLASLLARPARQALTAGDKDQEVAERADLGHGAFTYHLLDELKARAATPDQPLLTAELYASLKVGVGNDTAGKQNVQFGSYGGTQGEFLFLSTAPRPVPAIGVSVVKEPTAGPKPGDVRKNEKDGAEMVYVPPGEFTMSSDEGQKPVHRVRLTRGYWIYRTEVTNAQYRRFLEATGHREPATVTEGQKELPQPVAVWHDDRFNAPGQPVVGVSWEDAKRYCEWAGGRLPTEAEWEYAARGPESRRWPWGSEAPDPSRALPSEPGYLGGAKTCGGRTAGASPFGALDMVGNVWEWCGDWYVEGFPSASLVIDPTGPSSSTLRVFRGGGWHNLGPIYWPTVWRAGVPPDTRSITIGMRVVVPAS